jgi:hypothetical protein
MDQSFFTTVVDLAKIGAAGVGLAIFLMVFMMVFRGKPVDPATARLREKFLIWGVAFAVVTGVFGLLPPLLQKEGGPIAMRLSFSPDFATESLTPPRILLPDGTISKPDEKFQLRNTSGTQVLTVGVDAALRDVRNLKSANGALLQSVSAAENQRDALAAHVATDSPAPAAQQGLENKAAEAGVLRGQVTESLKAGDYDKANKLSLRLRTSIYTAGPSVAAIVRPDP